VDFFLPELESDRNWELVFDTKNQAFEKTPAPVSSGQSIPLIERSMALLRARNGH